MLTSFVNGLSTPCLGSCSLAVFFCQQEQSSTCVRKGASWSAYPRQLHQFRLRPDFASHFPLPRDVACTGIFDQMQHICSPYLRYRIGSSPVRELRHLCTIFAISATLNVRPLPLMFCTDSESYASLTVPSPHASNYTSLTNCPHSPPSNHPS